MRPFDFLVRERKLGELFVRCAILIQIGRRGSFE